MKETKENKTHGQQFNPRITMGIIGSADLETLQKLNDFFKGLDGFSLIYLRTSGSPLYITDKKPDKEPMEEE